MNSIVGDKYIAELVQIFEQQGLYTIENYSKLCTTSSMPLVNVCHLADC